MEMGKPELGIYDRMALFMEMWFNYGEVDRKKWTD